MSQSILADLTGFIPDTHRHNDHVQTYYQGVFLDGVKRFIDYLVWNNDEEGKPLIESTLVIVTADIIRGPNYFDQGIHGKSDFRNNSVILIGGGLNHTTQVGEQTLPGRVIGYSHGGFESGRIDKKTGTNTAKSTSASDRDNEKITYASIYASLLEGYGFDKENYYKGEESIKTLASNLPGKPDEIS